MQIRTNVVEFLTRLTQVFRFRLVQIRTSVVAVLIKLNLLMSFRLVQIRTSIVARANREAIAEVLD